MLCTMKPPAKASTAKSPASFATTLRDRCTPITRFCETVLGFLSMAGDSKANTTIITTAQMT
jgi:hypothetical protein